MTGVSPPHTLTGGFSRAYARPDPSSSELVSSRLVFASPTDPSVNGAITSLVEGAGAPATIGEGMMNDPMRVLSLIHISEPTRPY